MLVQRQFIISSGLGAFPDLAVWPVPCVCECALFHRGLGDLHWLASKSRMLCPLCPSPGPVHPEVLVSLVLGTGLTLRPRLVSGGPCPPRALSSPFHRGLRRSWRAVLARGAALPTSPGMTSLTLDSGLSRVKTQEWSMQGLYGHGGGRDYYMVRGATRTP